MNATLTRCEPRRLPRPAEDAFERIFRDLWGPAEEGRAGLIAPVIDIAEDPDALTVTAELPGLDRKDIEVQVKDGVLTIRGEKKFEEKKEDRRYHRIERRYGSFYRAITLPDSVDPERVEASFRNGVLALRIARHEAKQPRTIEIAG